MKSSELIMTRSDSDNRDYSDLARYISEELIIINYFYIITTILSFICIVIIEIRKYDTYGKNF